MSKLSFIWMIPGGPGWCKARGIDAKVGRYLLETFNLSLGNTGNALSGVLPVDVPASLVVDARFITPMFGYPESRKKWPETYANTTLMPGRHYLYDCGDGAFLGTDEPGTRGPANLRAFDWGRAYQRVYDALIDYPGIKPVVTMPFNGALTDITRDFADFGASIVYAFDAHVIEMAGVNDEMHEHLNVPDGAEVWAYHALYEDDNKYADPYRAGWMEEWVPTPTDKPHEIIPWAADRDVKCILHNTDLKHLVDATKPPRTMLRANAVAMLTAKMEALRGAM